MTNNGTKRFKILVLHAKPEDTNMVRTIEEKFKDSTNFMYTDTIDEAVEVCVGLKENENSEDNTPDIIIVGYKNSKLESKDLENKVKRVYGQMAIGAVLKKKCINNGVSGTAICIIDGGGSKLKAEEIGYVMSRCETERIKYVNESSDGAFGQMEAYIQNQIDQKTGKVAILHE